MHANVDDIMEHKRYGFGYTMFLRYSNMEIFDNILNRDYFYCIRDVEKQIVLEEEAIWENLINEEHLFEQRRNCFKYVMIKKERKNGN